MLRTFVVSGVAAIAIQKSVRGLSNRERVTSPIELKGQGYWVQCLY